MSWQGGGWAHRAGGGVAAAGTPSTGFSRFRIPSLSSQIPFLQYTPARRRGGNVGIAHFAISKHGENGGNVVF